MAEERKNKMAIEWGWFDPPLPMSASQDEKMTAPLIPAASRKISSATLYHEIIRVKYYGSHSAGTPVRFLWYHTGTGEKVFDWSDKWTDPTWKWYQGWIGHLPDYEIYKAGTYRCRIDIGGTTKGTVDFVITSTEFPETPIPPVEPPPPPIEEPYWTLDGKVLDKNLKTPIYNAAVKFAGISASSKIDGYYLLRGTEGFSGFVDTSAPGYEDHAFAMSISLGQTPWRDILMTPVAVPPPPAPPPEAPWWERILRFEEDGTLHFTNIDVAPINLGPWLEDHYLDKPLELIAKTAFYGVLAAASGAILWKVFTVVGSAIAAKLGEHIAKDSPKTLETVVEKLLEKGAPEATIAANPVVSKLLEIFGAKTPLRLLGKFLVGVAGVSVLASWLSTDNIVTGTGFTLTRLKAAVNAGTITKEQALLDIKHIQEWKDEATRTVSISTAINPLLWAFRNVFMINSDKAQLDIDLAKAEITALIEEARAAFILIQSNPEGAGIYIDGEYKFIKTNFQFLLPARPEPYFIQISAPSGYKNPIGRSVTVVAEAPQTVNFGDLTPLAYGEIPEPFIPVPIEVPVVPEKPPEVKPNAWKYTITARDIDTGRIVSAKIIVNGIFTDKWTTNFIILEPSAEYSLRLEAYGYEAAELMLTTEALP